MGKLRNWLAALFIGSAAATGVVAKHNADERAAQALMRREAAVFTKQLQKTRAAIAVVYAELPKKTDFETKRRPYIIVANKEIRSVDLALPDKMTPAQATECLHFLSEIEEYHGFVTNTLSGPSGEEMYKYRQTFNNVFSKIAEEVARKMIAKGVPVGKRWYLR